MKYTYDICLEDSWLEFYIDQFKQAKEGYCKALRDLNNIVYEKDKPVATKIFISDYYKQDDPHNKAELWKEISEYIKENECVGWEYQWLDEKWVDVNTDPYDDYENLTVSYTVYATISGDKDNVEETLEYKQQLALVERLYIELMEAKNTVDNKVKQ